MAYFDLGTFLKVAGLISVFWGPYRSLRIDFEADCLSASKMVDLPGTTPRAVDKDPRIPFASLLSKPNRVSTRPALRNHENENENENENM
jgi:hypothetical protein